ncbi:MAG: elongation factor G [Kiritimatiellia bacterium]
MARKIPLDHIRNIGIMAHIDAGKTTTSERILFYSGKNHKIGEVHDGGATMDWMVQEQERGITITSAATAVMWGNYMISLIDTPGHVDFTAEVERSLRVLDGAVAVFCAVGGVQPQSEQVWRQSEKYKVPKLIFVNKMDRVGANFFAVMKQVRDQLKARPIPMECPLGAGETFEGVVDLLENRLVTYDKETQGLKQIYSEIPADLKDQCEEMRHEMIEAAAEQDEALMNKYFEEGTLTKEEIIKGLRKGVIARTIMPAFCGTAFKNKGIQVLLDAVVHYLPSPKDIPPVTDESDPTITRPAEDNAPLSALAFKIMSDKNMGKIIFTRVYSGTLVAGSEILDTSINKTARISRLFRMHANHQEKLEEAYAGDIVAVIGLPLTRTGDTLCDPTNPIQLESIDFPAPVISIAVKPLSRGDNEKLGVALHTLAQEDPTFTVSFDQETSETIISGMGELHLEIIVDRLKREFGVACEVGRPEVAYRESIATLGDGEYKHKKQSGGRGQYGHVCMKLAPQEQGKEFEFINAVKGGNIPGEYIPAVEKGTRAAMESGPLAGYPVLPLIATLYDGSYHDVDSSEFAFSTAARQCFKEIFLKSQPQLLEPIMKVEVVVPEDYMGAATGSLSQRRGRIEGMEERGGARLVHAFVPLGEMFGYSNSIRTLTQGRGSFTMVFDHYEAVPKTLQDEIVTKRRKDGKVRGYSEANDE